MRRRQPLLPASATVTGIDLSYRGGVVEAFVGLNDIVALAKTPGVSSVILAVKPLLDVGATTSQGVVQHRVNTVTREFSDNVARIVNKVSVIAHTTRHRVSASLAIHHVIASPARKGIYAAITR